jgi:glutamyl-tRNA reductase
MDEPIELHLLGVSFRTAPVAIREGLSFGRDQAAALLRAAAAAIPGLQAFLLSTCNRTEFYLAAPAQSPAVEAFLGVLLKARPHAPILRDDCHRYSFNGVEAARHLFRVAAGLDSAILGDSQILGQIKEAMSVASEAGTLGGTVHQTLVQAIQAGKRARTETKIGYGAASLGSAIASSLAEHETDLRRDSITPRVLIIGAGEIARDIGRHVAKGRTREITFLNRTQEKAAQLAADCGGRPLAWDSLGEALAQNHFIIAATSCPKPILTHAVLQSALQMASPAIRLVIDAGMPRNVEPGSEVSTMDIDAIRERQGVALARRRAAVPAVEAIVEDTVNEWEQWQASRPVETLIKSLYQEAAAISRIAAGKLSGTDEVQRVATERLLHHSMKRLLTGHARSLRRLHGPERPVRSGQAV